MIGSLRGTLLDRRPRPAGGVEVLVEVGGVGYRTVVPAGPAGSLGPLGAAVFLHVHTHVREDAIVLYGFPTRESQEYMWIAINTWTGHHLKGQLANDPQMRLDLRAGQTVEVSESDVFDWMLQLPGGRSQGNFTKAVLEREGQTKQGQTNQ